MASIHVRETSGKWQVAFRWQGKAYSRCTGTNLKKDAQLIERRVEDTLWRLKNAGLRVPEGIDPGDFILSGGLITDAVTREETPVTLAQLFERYRASLPAGAKEENTLYTERIHERNLIGLLGEDTPVEALTMEAIQTRYVNPRSSEVSKTTVIKELKTLRQVWGRGMHFKLLKSPPEWSLNGLNYSKPGEKIPFRTFDEIEAITRRGGPDTAWKGLYLTGPELEELLNYVESTVRDPIVFPLVAYAALTGARRSELLRAEVADLNFDRREITLHERKRVKGQPSTRIVEMHGRLEAILGECLPGVTGGSLFEGVDIYKADRLLRQALAKHPKYSKVRGWHVLRHSFISALALAGVDPRIIQAMVGHTSPEMTAHYTHIGPKQTNRAIDKLLPG
jgi:integrase